MLEHNNHAFTFAISTNNLFHLSVYYFCLICIGNDSIDISKTMLVKQCKCCGSYFLTSQSRKNIVNIVVLKRHGTKEIDSI